MNKTSFKKQFDASKAQVEIDVQLKRRLSHQLFSMKSRKKFFWSWTKAIFTAPVLAAVAIILFLNSTQETIKQVLSPQEALAQALENTFRLGSFETTFGLPNDGQLYYRVINTKTPQGEGVIELWTDGVSMTDQSWSTAVSNTAADGFGLNSNYNSALYMPENEQVCHGHVYSFKPHCGASQTPDQQVFCATNPESHSEDYQNCGNKDQDLKDYKEGIIRYFQDDLFFPVALMEHKIDLSEPNSVKKIERNGQKVIELTYNDLNFPEEITKAYAIRQQPSDFIVHFYLSEDQTKFMGYSRVTKPNVEKYWKPNQELEFFWIEDKILPDSEKSKVFNTEEWKERYLRFKIKATN